MVRKEMIDKIISYEKDELNDEETIQLFQGLINNGMAWQLQGHYGRVATQLIEDGLCKEAEI